MLVVRLVFISKEVGDNLAVEMLWDPSALFLSFPSISLQLLLRSGSLGKISRFSRCVEHPYTVALRAYLCKISTFLSYLKREGGKLA
jgi:hypothetical protein